MLEWDEYMYDEHSSPSSPRSSMMDEEQNSYACDELLLHNDYRNQHHHKTWRRWMMHRLLAGGGGGDDDPTTVLYYGTLTVSVLTLGLLLFVEACRRYLEHSATHRPIFQAVLDGVYRELATLGIVELFIHLLHEYADNLDAGMEQVFVDVHFVLFYTAILNALQSVVLAVFCHRVSRRIWIRTEELELNHYVEIREEFDRVRAKLYGHNNNDENNKPQTNNNTDDQPQQTTLSTGDPANDNHQPQNDNDKDTNAQANNADADGQTPPQQQQQQQQQRTSLVDSLRQFTENIQQQSGMELLYYDSSSRGVSLGTRLKQFCVGIFYTIKYPRLKAKHDRLLVQVRFHEMRVHFLQAYDLPLKLKISTYLVKSQQHVLKHLIHISTWAWLWLTGIMCLLYFLTGIIANLTDSAHSSQPTLSAFYFSGMILFLVVSLAVYRQMQVIFMKIMEMKHLWDPAAAVSAQDGGSSMHPTGTTNGGRSDDDHHYHYPTTTASHPGGTHLLRTSSLHESTSRRFALEQKESLAAEQLGLFFLGDPKLVVIAIQFMQFGYAIALAIVMVYWDDMNSDDSHVHGVTYLGTTLVCYAMFIVVTAQTLPKYTMVTSLGQLVDRKRLHETVALFRLQEAERRHQQRVDRDFYHFSGGGGGGYHSLQQQQQQPQPPSYSFARKSSFGHEMPAVNHGGGGSHSPPEQSAPARIEPIQSAKASTPIITPATAVPQPPTRQIALPISSNAVPSRVSSAPLPISATTTVPSRVSSAPTLPDIDEHEPEPHPHPEEISSGLSQPPPKATNAAAAEGTVPHRGPTTAKPPPVAPPPKHRTSMPSIAESQQQAAIEYEKASMLANLVKMDTSSLREAVPLEDIRKAERRDRRKNRRKSVSDGVALMSAVGRVGQNLNIFGATGPAHASGSNRKEPTPAGAPKELPPQPWTQHQQQLTSPNLEAPKFAVDDSALLARKERRRNRKKAVSASAAIQLMRDFKENKEQKEPEGATASRGSNSFDFWSAKPLPAPATTESPEPLLGSEINQTAVPKPTPTIFESVDDSVTAVIETRQRKERRHRTRKKALSASAAVKLMREGDDDDEERAREFFAMSPTTASVGAQSEEHLASEDNYLSLPTPARGPGLTFQSLSQSERLLQNESFLANLARGESRNENVMLMPVRELSVLEDSSSHFNHDPIVPMPETTTTFEPAPLELFAAANGCHPTKVESEDIEDVDDEDTVETDRSIGGLSHVGDADDCNFRRRPSFLDEDAEDKHVSFRTRLAQRNDKMRHLLLTKTYSFFTHMLGTMFCFFILGMRVEAFLKQRCIIPWDDKSWEFGLKTSFWFAVIWMLAFIVMSAWTIQLFPAWTERKFSEQGIEVESKRVQWILCLAGLIDMVLSFTCLIIFLGAEINRCCNGNEYPQKTTEGSYHAEDSYGNPDHSNGYLYNSTKQHASNENHTDYDSRAETNDSGEPATKFLYRYLAGAYDSYEITEECQDTTVFCNCPKFGTRTEGGLGSIEPFTALIVLRMFRFILARFLVRHLDLGGDQDDLKKGESSFDGKSRKSHLALTNTHGGHSADNFVSGTIVELWQAAVSKYPSIVEKHGEFSGELLQAMLGVEVTESHYPMLVDTTKSQEPAFALSSSPKGSEAAPNRALHRYASSDNLAQYDHVTLESKKYSNLAPEIQSIIVSGQMGMPCKATQPSLRRIPTSHDLSDDVDDNPPLEFEVDVAQMEMDKFESASTFEYPNARLVRSMRRCEKKLLPLLDHWSPVDVIITKFEIVYVHVSEHDGSENHSQLREAGRLALVATKGGKGLRLCDVTAGRRVIGQLSFSDILSVYVEREQCVPGTTSLSTADGATAELSHGHVEYWQESTEGDPKESAIDLDIRWQSVSQDSLKIQTLHDTLLLRFYTDLEDSEAHPERVVNELDENATIYKNIAFQWALTLTRNVGQLKQPLPHFGTNDSDELRDLLQVVSREEKHGHRRFASGGLRMYNSRGHRRLKSRQLPALDDLNTAATDDGQGKPDEHPPRKAGKLAVPHIPRPRKLTRFASQGGDEESAEADDENRAVSIG